MTESTQAHAGIGHWKKNIGERVRATMQSPEMERYFSVTMTIPRAQLHIEQLSLFVTCRRECWANVLANCTELPIKQRLLQHEYEELVEDDYSPAGHLDLIIRQGKIVGLSPDDFLRAKPLRTSLGTFYGWKWITRQRSWQEGLVAMMATEWVNDDRLLAEQGGGLSRRDGVRWVKDFGFPWDKMPNFAAHSEADEKHSDLFLPYLPGLITEETKALEAADEALELFKLYHKGLTEEMERMV